MIFCVMKPIYEKDVFLLFYCILMLFCFCFFFVVFFDDDDCGEIGVD